MNAFPECLDTCSFQTKGRLEGDAQASGHKGHVNLGHPPATCDNRSRLLTAGHLGVKAERGGGWAPRGQAKAGLVPGSPQGRRGRAGAAEGGGSDHVRTSPAPQMETSPGRPPVTPAGPLESRAMGPQIPWQLPTPRGQCGPDRGRILPRGIHTRPAAQKRHHGVELGEDKIPGLRKESLWGI